MTLAYRIIRSEHYEIDLVMRCLHNLADALHREAWRPDFDLLLLILHYVESFPATFHHPKEEDYLFKAVRCRKPETGPMFDQLCDDRAEGVALASDLRQSLETYMRAPPLAAGSTTRRRATRAMNANTCYGKSGRSCRSRFKCSARRIGERSMPPSSGTDTPPPS